MFRNFILLMILVTVAFQAFGQEILIIKQGETSKIDGFVIDNKMETQMRTYKEENKKLKEVNVELKSLGDLQDIRCEVYKKNIDVLTTENTTLQTRNTLNGVIFLIIGAVVTGGISYGVIQTLK